MATGAIRGEIMPEDCMPSRESILAELPVPGCCRGHDRVSGRAGNHHGHVLAGRAESGWTGSGSTVG
jgi:hypothetical protein